ncbi:Probable protein phosphatase 2C 39, partial [Linum grandiflorum]
GWKGDVRRVDGQLAVIRAFGDRSLKIHLSSEPEETVDDEAEFLIPDSDGLWNALIVTCAFQFSL